MKAAALALACTLSLLAVAAVVMVFVFLYVAVFTPGYDDDLTGASFVTLLAAIILGGSAGFSWFAYDVVRDS